ncbi:hypothetical protein [Enterovibrio norvegicus]|uniref:Curli production assembly/transport component CsgG n=1 Tax=Enterovibrio norvegicus TaxID=188144 RepID=A0A2N7L727_9GAMM|nr:hypothetical protein [Enterovibrio norvegicus]PMN89767.1 hypothetical protein BCT23_21895 [Enterovibrio norvegicus]
MFKKGLVAVALTTALTGCGVTAVCPPGTEIEMETAGIPAKASDELKVIVLPVDMEFKDAAKGRLQTVFRNDLEATIEGTGAKLVDRKLANKLKGEIKLAEQSGRYNKSGVPIADLAVITEVTASNLSSSFSEAYSYENDDGETKYVPAKCTFTTEVKAVAKVVSLPDMNLVQRIELGASDYSSTETNNSRCPISNAQYTGMASEAAEKAVAYNFELQKLLAPSAPVTAMRQCEAGTMVKVAMGSKKKLEPGTDITLSQIHKSDEGDVETYTLGEGYVVKHEQDAVKPNFSWVAIDEEMSLRIRKGDSAKVVPEECPILNPLCHLNQLGL